jgi:hypothetical protein
MAKSVIGAIIRDGSIPVSAINANVATVETVEDRIATYQDSETWYQNVLSIESTPPELPQDGDRYIVGVEPTGDWTGHEDKIAQWNATDEAWDFIVPETGKFISVSNVTNGLYQFDGSDWQKRAFEANAPGYGIGIDGSGRINIQRETQTFLATGDLGEAFALDYIPNADGEDVYLNGSLKDQGLDKDYIIEEGVGVVSLKFNSQLALNDKVTIKYFTNYALPVGE